MSDNDWKARLGVVYSTSHDYEYDTGGPKDEASLPPSAQNLRVWVERRSGGKSVTVVRGFAGSADDLKALAALLKSRCGVGGSAKDGEILIQGDRRERVLEVLAAEGYRAKKAGG